MWLRPVFLCALAALVACGSSASTDGDVEGAKEKNGGSEAADEGGLSAAALRERPWEVVSKKGETQLANVFYADRSENEQIMPWTIDGRAMIERLIYPTLGNPNLYVKGDADDELTTVLRLEDDAFAHLTPQRTADPSGLTRVKFATADADDGIAFFLVARSARASAEAAAAQSPGAGVYAIRPKDILENPEPAGMPTRLKGRHTLRFVFGRAAMKDVPPGLYDVRFEVRKSGSVYANVFEYQYNAVRVFESEGDEYTALNVTDTQVSTGLEYAALTADKLDDFVDGVNASTDPNVKNAAFVTFNGDLHNGGSPGSIRQRVVATTYASEAKRIVDALKRLDLPIFLTAGNHDGIAAVGHVPKLVKDVDRALGQTLEKVIDAQNDIAWPGYDANTFGAYLARTAETRGGLSRDIIAGGYERRVGPTFEASFKEVPRDERNMILYDGFYQWQKTYGPLYASWTFGKNRYVSMNSFELRQHRRTGWGMYTVNYGGGMSKMQLEWLDRELARGKAANQDMIVLMHHDPRGGHSGKDLGYYPPILAYKDIAQSTLNYLIAEKLVPRVCKQPDWSLSVEDRASCLHDGLQEWMGPDEEFEKEGAGYFLSGVELLKRFVANPHARTLVLGHVHYNSLEVLQSGDVLVPDRLALDNATKVTSASIEAMNPVRRLAWEETLLPRASASAMRWHDASNLPSPRIDTGLTIRSWDSWRGQLDAQLRRNTPDLTTLMAPLGESRELAIIRFTSGADLTSQTHDGAAMYGYSVMHVTKQTAVPRLNRLTYFIHTGVDAFAKVQTIDIDRTSTVTMSGPGNPVDRLFEMKK